MKKVVFFISIISSLSLFSQGIEISPTVSYMFGGRVNFYEGDLKIVDKGAYGLNVAYDFGYEGGLEFSWIGTNTTAHYTSTRGTYDNLSFKLGVNHFQLGTYKDFGSNKIKGFGNLSVGATVFQPKEYDIADKWNFTASLALGMKWFPLDFLGIKLFGRLLLPMEFAGGGAYCGIGTGGAGCGVGVSTYAILVQGDLGGSIIFKISTGRSKSKKK
jgi:hypothetical protein